MSDDELGDGVECNYTKRDTMSILSASCFMMRMRVRERKKKLIKCVRIFVGHIETNKISLSVYTTVVVFFWLR